MYDPMNRLAALQQPQVQLASNDPNMDQRILQAVMEEQAIKKAKAPAISQQEVKRRIASTDGGKLEMQSQVPQSMVNQFQKEDDKTHQEVIREYMKKREALAKNSEDRSRIIGDSFQGQTDLSPLMALSDTWFGGNLSKGYNAPETQQQNMAAQQQFDNQARSEYGALTDDEMNMLRQQLMGEQYEANRELGKDKLDLARDAMNKKGSDLKPMSGEMVKRLDNIAGMDRTLKQMKKLTGAGNEESAKTFLSQNMSLAPDTKFGLLLRNASEYYGRMQSGGAIQQEEAKRFIMSMFKPNDSVEIRMEKYKEMEAMIRERAQSISYGRDEATLPKSLRNILGSSSAPKTSTQNSAALAWAKANPNDPRAAAVMAKANRGM